MEPVGRILPRVLVGILCGGGDCDRPAAPGDTHCADCRAEIERTYGEEAVS